MSPDPKTTISDFITGSLLADGPSELADDEELFSSSIIDSMNLIELVAFIEGEYGISIGPTELTLENFDSVQRMADFVARKRA